MKMTELFVGLPCFILGMIVMYIFDSREYNRLAELSEKTFNEIVKIIMEIKNIEK
jgi:hypothetical protein